MLLTAAKGSAEHPQPTRHLRLVRRNDLSLREITGGPWTSWLANSASPSRP